MSMFFIRFYSASKEALSGLLRSVSADVRGVSALQGYVLVLCATREFLRCSRGRIPISRPLSRSAMILSARMYFFNDEHKRRWTCRKERYSRQAK